MTFYTPLDGPRGVDTAEKELAARWVVNMEDGPKRRELFNGHRMRRIEREEAGLGVTDHAEADAWLVEQWKAREK